MMDECRDKMSFLKWRQRSSCSSRGVDDLSDEYESWEAHAALLESKHYPALVAYCEREIARDPGNLYAYGRLGEAYVLNGQYQKAIDSMGVCHRDYPDVEDFQYIILDALFSLGKTENDFLWFKAPTIIRLDTQGIDHCYEYLRPKRKPRSVDELHMALLVRGYVTFTHEQLVQALAADERFIVEREEDCYWAEVSIRRTRPRSTKG